VRFSLLTGEPVIATAEEVILLLYRNEIAGPAGAPEATTDPTRSRASVTRGRGIAVRQAPSDTMPELAIANRVDNSDDTNSGPQDVNDRDHRPDGTDPGFAVQLVIALPSLRRQAMALTRHRADAEDLLQTAMTNALGAQDSFRAGTNFRAWMSCILRNQFFSEIRRRRVFVDIDDAPPSQLGRSGGQEEGVLLQETQRFIADLPSAQQAALSMVAIEGLSYEEVAGHLGIPIGTVKARVFRARESLQHWMHGRAGGRCVDRSADSRAAAR
jgi:RNA polymerase sigma-70 factor (ECF subfamily)